MRLTGRGIWGEPDDRAECIRTVRRAIELGVQLVDTADSYGPHVSEAIIREALYPYPDDVVIATKVGLTRNGPDVVDTAQGAMRLGPQAWPPVGRPEYLRQQVLLSLRRLGLDHIDLLQLHRVDPQVPLADQVGELKALQDEGKIVEIGLSQVGVEQLEEARAIARIATVQNRYNLIDRGSADVMEYCTREGIGFIPWAPLAQGGLPADSGPLAEIAAAHGVSGSQVAIAWLLARSPTILPIPGTSKVSHLENNLAGAAIELRPVEIERLTGLV
ncbi:putative oxidoreductase [Pseudonocardia sp. Ae505_Ps2]|nr:putative oxidoreductase [Pseudonocardia sp. Ae505_Ps2]